MPTPSDSRPTRPSLVAIAASVAALLLATSPALAVEPGERASDFTQKSLDGKGEHSLSEHRGKVVYLDFWASWCTPCAAAIPMIEELRREFPEDDFQVLAVNLDKSATKARKFLKKNPVGYPIAHDPRGRIPKQFGVETMPTSYLIDRDGVVRYVHRGFRKDDIDEIRAEISKLVERGSGVAKQR